MRNKYFDVLKAIAITAVVLYHMGICKYGYLGVDIFLVVAGFFTSQSVEKLVVNKRGYIVFIKNRLFRLWPLLLLAGIVCLGFGWFMMLPDNFENMAQSIVATNFFGNNILAAITTKNYWDVSNDYKPLMHTWYVGLLMQYYIIVPMFLFVVGRFVKESSKRKEINIILFAVLFITSLVAYFLEDSMSTKFYFLPFRLYEFCAGGLMFYLFVNDNKEISKNIWVNVGFVMVYLAVITLLFVDAEYVSRSSKLLTTVALTSVLLVMMPRVSWSQGALFSNKWLAIVGSASFSVFVWHQVIIAFTRYSFTSCLEETRPFIIVIALTSLLAVFSYKYIEQMKISKSAWASIISLLIITTSFSLYIYQIAGVVRDVPELEVVKGKIHRGMWAEYCDRGYQYDRDFSNSEKTKFFVIGNSFGRDMVNVILESPISDRVEIVYSPMETYKKEIDRFEKADVVLLSTLGVNKEIIEDVKSRCPSITKFYIVGEKNFGENNGQIYRHRLEKDYHQMSCEIEKGIIEKNNSLKAQFPDIYIDMINLMLLSDGKVRVFTNDGKFISQDCHHLTKAGAKFYSELIDWTIFF